MNRIFASLILSVVACGGSPLDPGNGNQGGTGTNTLLVTGSAVATPRVANATAETDFNTEFNIRVSLNNVPVQTGTVTIKSRFVNVPLTWNNNGNNQGHWQGMAAGYDVAYELDVSNGTDAVNGVIVDGPDIHTITAPTAGATLDATMMFNLTWNRANPADEADFSVGDTNGLVIPDSGSYSVAPGSLRTDPQQARTNTLRITRTNRTTPAGAVTGSMFSVGVSNELDVVAAPCATCQN